MCAALLTDVCPQQLCRHILLVDPSTSKLQTELTNGFVQNLILSEGNIFCRLTISILHANPAQCLSTALPGLKGASYRNPISYPRSQDFSGAHNRKGTVGGLFCHSLL